MAWYAPISQTTTVTAPNAGDGVYIGPAVTISGPEATESRCSHPTTTQSSTDR
jgi:hypothetical protein